MGAAKVVGTRLAKGGNRRGTRRALLGLRFAHGRRREKDRAFLGTRKQLQIPLYIAMGGAKIAVVKGKGNRLEIKR